MINYLTFAIGLKSTHTQTFSVPRNMESNKRNDCSTEKVHKDTEAEVDKTNLCTLEFSGESTYLIIHENKPTTYTLSKNSQDFF